MVQFKSCRLTRHGIFFCFHGQAVHLLPLHCQTLIPLLWVLIHTYCVHTHCSAYVSCWWKNESGTCAQVKRKLQIAQKVRLLIFCWCFEMHAQGGACIGRHFSVAWTTFLLLTGKGMVWQHVCKLTSRCHQMLHTDPSSANLSDIFLVIANADQVPSKSAVVHKSSAPGHCLWGHGVAYVNVFTTRNDHK